MGNEDTFKDAVIIVEEIQPWLFGNLHLEHSQRYFLDEISFKFPQLVIALHCVFGRPLIFLLEKIIKQSHGSASLEYDNILAIFIDDHLAFAVQGTLSIAFSIGNKFLTV